MPETTEEHRSRMQRLKASVDRRIESAQEERGLLIVYTGAGKGKTTAALGLLASLVLIKRERAPIGHAAPVPAG